MIYPDKEYTKWAEVVWSKITAKMEEQCNRIGSRIPYTQKDGRTVFMEEKNLVWWTNGFWPGMLWLMYSDTKDEKYRIAAEAIEKNFDNLFVEYEKLQHDLGFMWTCTSRLSYKLTGNPLSRVRALHAASILAGRFNPKGHFLRAWNGDRTGWIIIDCMMNLPLLYWASREINDPRFKYIAMEHADTTLKHLVRSDGSCHHIGILDPDTGALLETPGGQGYAPGSSWSRGQSWAIYGFALSYIHTGEERYLEASLKIARYVIGVLRRTGYIPPADYAAPAEPERIDTSAGMIAAAGLNTLAGLEKNSERDFCRDSAVTIINAIEAAHADWNPQTDFLIKNGSAQYNGKPDELHIPLIYGDYFFLETLYRFKNPDFQVW